MSATVFRSVVFASQSLSDCLGSWFDVIATGSLLVFSLRAPTVGRKLGVCGVDSASATYALHTTVGALKLIGIE